MVDGRDALGLTHRDLPARRHRPPHALCGPKPNQGNDWQLLTVGVDALTIHASSGEPIDVELELVGESYAFNTGLGFPSTSLDVSTKPFIFSDLASTSGGSARLVREMGLSIRNNIDRSRFLNSLTLTALNKLHREIMWHIDIPAGGYDADWSAALSAGIAAVATFTQPSPLTAVLTMTSGAVRYVPKNPTIPFKAESFLGLLR